eukprot:scaffold20478_cov52-Attheya_sp.AAC.1
MGGTPTGTPTGTGGGKGTGGTPTGTPTGGGSSRRRTQQNMANSEARMLQGHLLPATYSYNPSLSNIDWVEFTLEDFREALQCEDIPSDARPIHSASTWRQLRQTYEDVVGPRRSSIGQTMSDLEANEKGQIEIIASQDANNLYAGNVPGKGRGMIASRDIKEGESIWSDVYMVNSTWMYLKKRKKNSQCLPTSPPLVLHTIFLPKAAFYDSRDLNRFLAVLPSELACDVILWTYDHQDDNPDDFYFSVDLDLSTFCNDGGSSDNNVQWKYDVTVNTATATRDINAGEEILCDYGGDYKYENGYLYKEEGEY